MGGADTSSVVKTRLAEAIIIPLILIVNRYRRLFFQFLIVITAIIEPVDDGK